MRNRKYKYDLTRYDISSDKIKKNFKAIVLADIHTNKSEELIDIVKRENVDVIFIPGDFVHHNTLSDLIDGVSFLTKLGEIAPIYYEFGNHEEKYKFNSKHFDNIDNLHILKSQYLSFNNIIIGGILESTFTEEWLRDFDKQDGFKILLCHKPEMGIKILKDIDVNLIISGHAHGGQIRFLNKALYAPGQGFMPKYTSGMFNEGDDKKLIISRGLCNTAPRYFPRLFNNPEIILINFINNIF